MLSKSKIGRLLPEPVKREQRRSNRRQKLSNTASGPNGSDDQSDASSAAESLAKPEPASLATGPQKKSNETTSDDKFVVEVDASTNAIRLNKLIFGTNSTDSSRALVNQVVNVVLTTGSKLDSQNVKWALATIYGIGPKDELEGLLAVQMVGVHSVAMECLRRASGCQTIEGMDANINHATKLLRTFTTQMEALNRHRGKVGQQMVVGNVNVNDGGQAIVGPVSGDGRGKASTEDGADKVE